MLNLSYVRLKALQVIQEEDEQLVFGDLHDNSGTSNGSGGDSSDEEEDSFGEVHNWTTQEYISNHVQFPDMINEDGQPTCSGWHLYFSYPREFSRAYSEPDGEWCGFAVRSD